MSTVRLQIIHRATRRKYRRPMKLDGLTITIGETVTTVEGEAKIAAYVAEKLPAMLRDGMLEGSILDTYKKGPQYQ